MTAAAQLDQILHAAAAEALRNARDPERIRQDRMCVRVDIPLKFRAADLAAAEARLLRAEAGIKKIAAGHAAQGAHRRVIEPYQCVAPEGPNYQPPPRPTKGTP